VAETLTQGVLVSVSAIAYTRILVSDRIGAWPYRPFSSPGTPRNPIPLKIIKDKNKTTMHYA